MHLCLVIMGVKAPLLSTVICCRRTWQFCFPFGNPLRGRETCCNNCSKPDVAAVKSLLLAGFIYSQGASRPMKLVVLLQLCFKKQLSFPLVYLMGGAVGFTPLIPPDLPSLLPACCLCAFPLKRRTQHRGFAATDLKVTAME